jgi:hypothetical protein
MRGGDGVVAPRVCRLLVHAKGNFRLVQPPAGLFVLSQLVVRHGQQRPRHRIAEPPGGGLQRRLQRLDRLARPAGAQLCYSQNAAIPILLRRIIPNSLGCCQQVGSHWLLRRR